MRVRVEVAVFTVRDRRLDVLLARGPGGAWLLPAGDVADGQPLDAAASAAVREVAGIRDIAMEQLFTFDRPPDAACVAYLALIDAGRHPLSPGPEAVEVRWFPHDDLPEALRARSTPEDTSTPGAPDSARRRRTGPGRGSPRRSARC